MIRPDLYKRYQKIRKKWKLYKSLRTHYPEECIVGTENFLDWKQRENMFEDILFIIECSNQDD